jgi:hypothetical protein
MILINNPTQADLFFTLNEKLSTSNPNFELELINKQTNEEFYFTLSNDLSVNPTRYNHFVLDLSTLIEGQYDYTVRDKSVPLNNILEIGLLVINTYINNTIPPFSTTDTQIYTNPNI